MFPAIKCIHPEGFEKSIQRFQCEEFEHVYISSEHFEVPFFETKPIEEWKAPKGFPLCCKFHTGAFEDIVDKINKFPYCCASHKRLAKQRWFNKNDYKGLPIKLLHTLSHTEYHILNKIDKDDWYKDITDYIDYCVISFGQLPDGFGSPVGLTIYLGNVQHVLKTRDFVSKAKEVKLTSYIDVILNGKESEVTDMNLLLSTYSKWFKTFPFELSFFAHLKDKYKKDLPILKEKPEYNTYLKTAKAKLKTRSELIAFLIERTEHLLSEINTLALYEKGQLSEPRAISLEILTKGRKLYFKGIREKFTDERKNYIKVIKEWYKGEEEFMHKLIPLIQGMHEPQIDQKKTFEKKLKETLAEYGFFELSKVKALSPIGQEKILMLVAKESLPYKVAMFDYLGLFEHLERNHFTGRKEMYKAVSEWLNADKEGRSIKGNINSLKSYTEENKERYTAHTHKVSVEKAYQELK